MKFRLAKADKMSVILRISTSFMSLRVFTLVCLCNPCIPEGARCLKAALI